MGTLVRGDVVDGDDVRVAELSDDATLRRKRAANSSSVVSTGLMTFKATWRCSDSCMAR